MQKFKRIISWILVLALALTSSRLEVIAATADEAPAAVESEMANEEPGGLEEITEESNNSHGESATSAEEVATVNTKEKAARATTTVTTPLPLASGEFDGHTYYFYGSNSYSWEEALTFCESMNGYMATIGSQEENDFLYQLIRGVGHYNAYFGLTDLEESRVWKWANGEEVVYTNWASGEPSSTSENYAMFYEKFTTGQWNDGVFSKSPFLLECDSEISTITGTCGDGVDWSFYKGTLTISGEGAINDNAFKGNTAIKSVVIEEGITTIGARAFEGCKSLTEIELPESITTILYRSFGECDGLTEVEIPKNVGSSSSDYWFEGCDNLTKIVLEEGLTAIPKGAFRNLYTDFEIEIPKTVTTIGEVAFYNCNKLTKITLPKSLTVIGGQAFANCKSLLEVEIPETVTTLGYRSFGECDGLTEVEIPKNVGSSSSDYWFENCDNLTKITLEEGMTVIPKGAFRNIYTDFEIEIPETVTTIGEVAFYNCNNLTKITLPKSLTVIGGQAFANCKSLLEVEIPETVTTLGYRSFAECDSLTKVEIPKNVGSSSSDYWFENCDNLTKITLEEGMTVIPKGAFRNIYTDFEIEIPETVTTIGEVAFYNCNKLTKITLPKSLTVIGGQVFANCKSLLEVEIPETVTTLGYRAFAECDSLTEVEIPKNVGSSSSDYWFENCDNLTKIVLEEGMTTIPRRSFSNLKTDFEIEIPETVTIIGEGAFYGCTGVKKIELPSGLTKIDGSAFRECKSLEEITIPDSVTSIYGWAFCNCDALTQVTIPANVTVSGDGCWFINCDNLTKITLKEGMVTVPRRSFSDLYTDFDITIPETVTTIGEGAFYNCTGLKEISLPSGLTKIDGSAFRECKSLKEITIPDSVTHLYGWSFCNCDSLTQITIPANIIDSEGGCWFINCDNLTKITLKEGMTSIPRKAFSNLHTEYEITIPETVTTIKAEAFRNCDNVSRIYLPNGITTIESNAFAECEKLTIYCLAHSGTLSYAVDNGVAVGVSDANTVQRKVLSQTDTYYGTNSDSLTSSGYLDLIMEYSVEEENRDDISNMSVRVGFPASYTLIENSITVNGKKCTDCTVRTGRLDIPVSEAEGVIRFSVNPANDAAFGTAAQLIYTEEGEQRRDFIGSICSDVPMITLITNETTNTNTINVSGMAPAESLVEFFIDDVAAGEVNASKAGNYNTQITIPNATEGTTYKVKAVATVDGQTVEKAVSVKYSVDVPVVEELKLYYSGHDNSMRYYNRVIDLMSTRELQSVITFNPNYYYAFSVKMSNPELVDCVYVTSTRNGEKKAIRAEWDEQTKQFVTSEKFDGNNTNYVPGYVSVEYQLKSSEYDFDEEIDETYDEFFENVPEHVKNADVSKLKETTDGDVTTKETTVTLANEEKTRLRVVEERRTANYSETELINGGFRKVIDSSGDVKYVKIEIEDDSIREIIFDTGKDELVSYTIECLDLDDVVGGTYSMIGLLTDGGESLLDIAMMRMQIEMSNMSPAEKEIAMEKLQTVADYHASKLAISYIFFAVGIVAGLSFPASLVLVGAELFVQGLLKEYYNGVLHGEKYSLIGAFLKWIIDPSGYVYEAVTDNRLENVTATVYYQDDSGTAVKWNAKEYDQINPIITLNDGIYAWDVPEGMWQVKYEKEGYDTVYSEWMEVPPPQTDVNVGLVSYAVPEIKLVNVTESSVQLQFTKYMIPETVSGIVIKDSKGNNIPYTLEYSQEEKNADGTVYADSYTLNFNSYKLKSGEKCTITIPKTVKSYAGTEIKATTLSETYKGLAELSVGESLEVDCGMQGTLEVTLTTEREDLEVAAQSMFEELVQIKSVKETGDGVWKIVVEGTIPGTTAVEITVPGTTLKEYVTVTVIRNDTDHTHVFGEPVFEWNGYESCTATVTCECGYSELEDCALSEKLTKATFAKEGKRIYTAKVTIDGMDYSDSKSQIIPKAAVPTLSKTVYVHNAKAVAPTVTVKDTKGVKLVKGTDYSVTLATGRTKVGRYTVTVTLKGKYSGTKKLYFTIVPKKTTSLSAERYQYGNQVRLSWTKVTGASGYRIEFKKPGTAKYTFLKNTTSLNYTKSGLTANKTYSFKVTPYVTIGGTKYYGTEATAYRTTSIATVKKGAKLAQVSKPTISKSGTKIKVKWKNVANETGYEISQSTSKTGTKIVSTYKTTSGTSKLITAAKGKTYYYKVRAYRTVNGKKIYGAWSTVVKYKR